MSRGSVVKAVGLVGLAIAFSSCSPAARMNANEQPKADAVARRASVVRLVGAITTRDYQRNMVISPYGLRRLFAMLVLGARGRTHDRMAGALGVADEADAMPPSLPGLNVRDGMWTEFATQPSYEAAIRARFHADVFNAVELPQIERWVSLSTGGQIANFPLPPDTHFVAIDALAYRVKWAQPFETGNTKPGSFHAATGTMLIPMMHGEVTAQTFGDARAQYLRLPFTDGNSMLIALPARGMRPSTLTDAIRALDRRVAPMPVDLTLPRFSVTSHVDLVGPLERIGLAIVFSRNADFSAIFGRAGIGMSFAFQQGAIAVDERGARMSVVSVVGEAQSAQRAVPFKVDRPFAFVVEDTRSHHVLVAGIVAHP